MICAWSDADEHEQSIQSLGPGVAVDCGRQGAVQRDQRLGQVMHIHRDTQKAHGYNGDSFGVQWREERRNAHAASNAIHQRAKADRRAIERMRAPSNSQLAVQIRAWANDHESFVSRAASGRALRGRRGVDGRVEESLTELVGAWERASLRQVNSVCLWSARGLRSDRGPGRIGLSHETRRSLSPLLPLHAEHAQAAITRMA